MKSRCEPDIIAFNYQISAWSSVGTPEGLQHAKVLLDDLLTQTEPGHAFSPNKMTFLTVLKAYLQLDTLDAAETSENILLKMDAFRSKDPSIGDTMMYFNWVLKKWGERRCPDEAERSLDLMNKMICFKKGNLNEETSSNQLRIAFNIVMNNFSKVGGENAALKVENIFRSMNNNDFGHQLEPDEFSYSICMSTWARSRESNAATKVKDLLDEMITSYENGHKQLRPSRIFFDTVLKACSHANVDSHQNYPLTLAIDTFGRMKDSNEWAGEISPTTYSHMLAVCKKHMVNNPAKRSMLLVKLFEQCCEDGCLSSSVLNQYRHSLPKHVFDESLATMVVRQSRKGNPKKFRDYRDFPPEWSRKVT